MFYKIPADCNALTIFFRLLGDPAGNFAAISKATPKSLRGTKIGFDPFAPRWIADNLLFGMW